MFTIVTKKAFTACAARLAKAISVKDAFSIVQHYLKKEQDKVRGQHDYSAQFILDKIESYTLNRDLNHPIDKTRAANWLSKAVSGDDYNVTSAKLKAYKSVDLSRDEGVAQARETITLFEEYLYSRQHYQTVFDEILDSLKAGFEIPSAKSFDFNSDENSGEDFLAMLVEWASSDQIQYIYTEGCNFPKENSGSSTDWDKYLCLVANNGVSIKINFEYTDYEDSGLDDVSMSVSINERDLEEFLDQNSDVYGMDIVSEALEKLMIQFFGCSSESEKDIRPLECFDAEAISQGFQALNSAVKSSIDPENIACTNEDASGHDSSIAPHDCLMMLRPNETKDDISRVFVKGNPVSAVYYDEQDRPIDIKNYLNEAWGQLGYAFLSDDGVTVYFSPRKLNYTLGFQPKNLIFYSADKPYFGSINPCAAEVITSSGQRIVLPKA